MLSVERARSASGEQQRQDGTERKGRSIGPLPTQSQRRHIMKQRLSMLAGIGMGAGLMYWLDPVQGRRRRALVRDQLISGLAQSADLLDKAARDLRNRAWGSAAEAR